MLLYFVEGGEKREFLYVVENLFDLYLCIETGDFVVKAGGFCSNKKTKSVTMVQ